MRPPSYVHLSSVPTTDSKENTTNCSKLQTSGTNHDDYLNDYYSNRPNNNSTDGIDWERMTLAKFVANYNIVQKISQTQRNESLRTYELKNKKGFALKRTRECVIRYFLRYENNQEYHRALCVLFLPFRDEMSQIHTGDVTQLYLENQYE